VSGPGAVEDAYRHCEAITRARAANFYYGIRLLPRDRRRGMCAVYAFARRVDDIGDGGLQAAEKLSRLDAEGRALAELEAGEPRALGGSDPVIVALGDTYERFALPAGALAELIEGVRMDVTGVSYEHFEELVLYCRRVAGAIGRVCLPIFGARDQASTEGSKAEALADDLGVAMQLTNILRDVREDRDCGRVYLPEEDLVRFECQGDLLDARGASIERLIRFQAARNRDWFDRGLRLLPLLDRRSASCVLAMTGIYRRILDRIEEDPLEVTRRRISLPVWEKATLAARSLAGVRT
jgi:15-cis-phytoene synthase